MIARELSGLTPARRADLIYAEAQSELSTRLWHAALGDAEQRTSSEARATPAHTPIDSLLAMLGGDSSAAATGRANGASEADGSFGDGEVGSARRFGSGIGSLTATSASGGDVGMLRSVTGGATGVALGANARYGAAFAAAEARTGVPASALAAIVDAEAGKSRDGSWNAHSRNPRSSAAGLGQFLSGTWQEMARTPGTWLNNVARQRGWLDARGGVAPEARSELLALRYDPQASILTVADLARNNLDRLQREGFHFGQGTGTIAEAAYLSHHLGLGDTRRFLGAGLAPERARVLLTAQVGAAAAARRIQQAGGASQAHRQWLLGYIQRRIRPEQSATEVASAASGKL